MQDANLNEQFNKEKESFAQRLTQISNAAKEHKVAHDDNEECTGSMDFLEANIECLIEDLDHWTGNDRDSWLLVVSASGACAQGAKYAEQVLALIDETKAWNEKYSAALDPITQSTRRLNAEMRAHGAQGYGMAANNNFVGGNSDDDDDDDDKEDDDYGGNFAHTKNPRQKDITSYKVQFKAFLADKKREIEKHAESHITCQGRILKSQIDDLTEDLNFWNELDRSNWKNILEMINVESCTWADGVKKSILQQVDLTSEWESVTDHHQNYNAQHVHKNLDNMLDTLEQMQKDLADVLGDMSLND